MEKKSGNTGYHAATCQSYVQFGRRFRFQAYSGHKTAMHKAVLRSTIKQTFQQMFIAPYTKSKHAFMLVLAAI